MDLRALGMAMGCLEWVRAFPRPWAQRIAGDWRNSDASASPNLVLNALILVFSLRRLMPRRHGSSMLCQELLSSQCRLVT